MDLVLQAALGATLFALAIAFANGHSPGVSSRWQMLATPGIGVLAVWVALSGVVASVPVLAEMEAAGLRNVQSGRADVLVHGRKTRSCKWLATDGYVVDASGRRHEAAVSYIDDPTPGNTRPVGMQSFGWWRTQWDADVYPVAVEYAVWHSCGWMWPRTMTTVGPFEIGR